MSAKCHRCLLALVVGITAQSLALSTACAIEWCHGCGNCYGPLRKGCYHDCCGSCAYDTCCSGCGDCNPCGGPMCASWRPTPTTECWPGLTRSYACNTSRGFVSDCGCYGGPCCNPGGYYTGLPTGYGSPGAYVSPAGYSSPAPVHSAPSSCGCNSHASNRRAAGGQQVAQRRSGAVQQRSAAPQGDVVQYDNAASQEEVVYEGQQGRMPSQHRTVSAQSRRVGR
jgi:hypothetical protein